MPAEPQIKKLSHTRRNLVFWLLVLVFTLTLPALIFYTTGHRFTLVDGERTIVTTGGIYVSTISRNAEVYINEEPVNFPRLFRSAFYIQNINSGQHRLVVQEEGLRTWVKELPVDAYLVTEAAAFNVPIIPQLRLIPEFYTATGTAVILAEEENTDPYKNSSTTGPYVLADRYQPSTLIQNDEFEFINSLITPTTSTSTSFIGRIADSLEDFRFASQSSTGTAPTTSAPRIRSGDVELVERDEEIYAVWRGANSRIPFYFCLASTTASSTAFRYGEHVATQVEEIMNSTTTNMFGAGSRVCRPEIKLDRKRKPVSYYNFVPGSSDLVLLLLDDGLYVVEIDDRAWQNTQLLYGGEELEMVVYGGSIYVRERDRVFEIFTTLLRDS